MAFGILHVLTILAIVHSSVSETKRRMSTKEQRFYDKCNENGTMCYGDTESCVIENSCIHLISLQERDDDFRVEYMDLCSHNSNNTLDATFFGVGISSHDDKGDPTCNQPLEMKNFKLFLFWKEKKCFDHGVEKNTDIKEFGITKGNWTAACQEHAKQVFGNKYKMTKDPPDFILINYLRKYLYYYTGQGLWEETQPPYPFADSHQYESKDGTFFISNHSIIDSSVAQNEYQRSLASGIHTFNFQLNLMSISLLLTMFCLILSFD